MEKVSVIVPVYNSAKYLRECISSILNQTYKNLEIILVDDGSTDDSSIICDQFSNIDHRVFTIHKKNEGVSMARNSALEIASGCYILFIDSDDYIGPDYIEKLVLGIDGHDLSICGFTELYKNKNNVFLPKDKNNVSKNNAISLLFSDPNVCGFLVNKLYKKEIIDQYNLRLNRNIFLCEDLLFNVQYLLCVSNVVIVSSCKYFYRMRKSSATWKKNDLKFKNACMCFDIIENILDDSFINKEDFFKYVVFNLIRLSKKNLKESKKFLEIYKSVLKTSNFKFKIKLIVLMNFNFVYKYYMKFKIKNLGLFD